MAKKPKAPRKVEQLDWVGEPKKRGRPRKYENKAEAQAAASRAYRARKKAEREARRQSPTVESKIIDLSALPAYKVKK